MVDKKRLKEYIWIQRNIETLEDMLLEVDTKLQCITSQLTPDKISTTKNPDKFSDLISDRIKIEKSINNEIQKGLKEMVYIESVINKIDERGKLLMRYRYIDGLTWEEIAVKMHYTWQHMHRIHSQCLKDVIECDNKKVV